MLSTDSLVYPNLICIGAQKCGTTWVHKCLDQHPDVFMSTPKELNYFVAPKKLNQIDFEKYLSNFSQGRGKKIVGESTPGYFWTYDQNSKYPPLGRNRKIPSSIKQFLGSNVKFILALRNPVHRAISAYFHHFRQGRFLGNESILDCLGEHGIAELSFYKRHLCNWEKEFSNKHFIVIFFDDIVQHPENVLKKLLMALELSCHHPIKIDQYYNPGFQLKVIDDYLTIDLASQDKINGKFTSGNLKKVKKNNVIPKIYQKEVDILFDIFSQDIEYINNVFKIESLDWFNRDINLLIEKSCTSSKTDMSKL